MSNVTRRGKKLVDGDNWKNYPADMLWARAVSRLASCCSREMSSGEVAATAGWAKKAKSHARIANRRIAAPALLSMNPRFIAERT